MIKTITPNGTFYKNKAHFRTIKLTTQSKKLMLSKPLKKYKLLIINLAHFKILEYQNINEDLNPCHK